VVSICLFGSYARGTADPLSDKDVLIVGSAAERTDQLEKEWRSSGWNIARFTHSDIRRISRKRSLFIQHIKQEGRIVRDDNEFLSTEIDRYLPKDDYSIEITEAVRQLTNLPVSEGTYWIDLCIADILFAIVRNIAILNTASSGAYVFSYDLLVERMAQEFLLPPTQHDALIDLRHLKHAYRTRQTDAQGILSLATARNAAIAISNKLGKLGTDHEASPPQPDPYFHLRMTELNLLRQFDPRLLDSLRPCDPGYAEWQVICNPSGYPKPTSFWKIGTEAFRPLLRMNATTDYPLTSH